MTPPQEVSTGDHPPAMFNSATFNLDRYIQFRPQYPPALFEEIYSHHRNHGGKWDLAHDAGTGPGVVAEELSKRFATVAVSDPSSHYLEVARARLLSSSPSSSSSCDDSGKKDQERGFLFGRYPAEDMSTWLAPSSVDIVTIAEAIHWMEYDKVISSALQVLKPGTGTLALWVYGTCPFLDKAESKEAQDLLDRIHLRWEKRVVEKTCGSPDNLDRVAMARLRKASQVLSSQLDVVRLDESSWKRGSVRRIRWNSSRPGQGAYDLFGEDGHQSFIGPSDIVVDDQLEYADNNNNGQLTEEVDVRWIRGYFDHLYPDLPADDPESEELFSKLEEALGGPERKTRIRWVSSMILATKS